MLVFLQLIQVHEARAPIYDHTIALRRLDDIVVDDSNTHRLANTFLQDTLRFLVCGWQAYGLVDVAWMAFDISQSDS